MTGLAYSAEYQRERDPIRLAVVLALAFAVHFFPLAYLIMPAPPEPEPEELQTATVDISDFLADAPPPKDLQPDKVATLKLPAITPEAKVAPAAPVAPPSAVQTQAKPPEAAPQIPEAKAPEAVKPDAKTDKMAVVPFDKKENIAAFDENTKTTEVAPDYSHPSDRTSTAADNGPKNLPRGEAYMKDGESKIVFDREKRGEGNLPPIASSANSGSIKIEGSPDAGKGLDSPKPDRERPLAMNTPLDKPASLSRPLPPVVPTAPKTDEVAAPELKDQVSPASKPKIAGFEADPLGVQPTGTQVVQGPDKPAVAPKRKLDATPPPPAKTDAPEQPMPAIQRKSAKDDELAAFAAMLANAPSSTSGAGGETGDKPGIQARKGEKGHAGDGTLRPGNENSTSDVVTFNISSSAEEVDQPRFAKRLDPIAAYFKAVKRRTDTKWKAMVNGPGLRSRFAVGVVTIHVVVHKSGKLLEATVEHRTDGLPDEYAYMAKEAVERACNPSADPFSGELAKSDKAECYFSFFY